MKCTRCGHEKKRHQRIHPLWPIKCLDCSFYDAFHIFEKGGEVPTGIRDAIGDVVPDSLKNQELGTLKPKKEGK
jgi:hypothetical protein